MFFIDSFPGRVHDFGSNSSGIHQQMRYDPPGAPTIPGLHRALLISSFTLPHPPLDRIATRLLEPMWLSVSFKLKHVKPLMQVRSCDISRGPSASMVPNSNRSSSWPRLKLTARQHSCNVLLVQLPEDFPNWQSHPVWWQCNQLVAPLLMQNLFQRCWGVAFPRPLDDLPLRRPSSRLN